MKLISRIIQYARPFGAYAPQYVVFTFLGIIFGLATLILLIPLLEVIFDQIDPALLESYRIQPPFEFNLSYPKKAFYHYFIKYSDSSNKFGSLIFVCIVLVIANLIGNFFKYLSLVISATIRANLVRNLRDSLFEKINQLDIDYFSTKRKGDTLSRITNDVQEVERSMMYVLQVAFKEPVTILIYFIVLFVMQPWLTFLSLLILPIAGGIISGIAKKLKKAAVLNQQSIGRILNIVEESLSSMRVIKAFTAQDHMIKKFKDEDEKYAKINISMARKYELASPLSEFFGIVTISGILLIGGNLILNEGQMNPADFITYLVIFSQILTPAKEISKAISAIQKGNASAERIFDILDAKASIQEKPNAIALERFEKNIEFKKVGFAYEQDENVLSGIDFTIEKGKTVALVGPSGGGKSTLADLIPRFYDPTEGTIDIDGQDLTQLNILSLRKLIGVVTQESILFNDSVINNIAFGESSIDQARVVEAANIANAHEFIEKMAHGYETMVGERGTKLSGGQRQRLSIARAVYKNPAILILDEATSALDAESEKLVQDALTNLMKGRTSIVIAHRLSTIQHADEIFVIKDGRIVERGSHKELLSSKGLYTRLIEMQSL